MYGMRFGAAKLPPTIRGVGRWRMTAWATGGPRRTFTGQAGEEEARKERTRSWTWEACKVRWRVDSSGMVTLWVWR